MPLKQFRSYQYEFPRRPSGRDDLGTNDAIRAARDLGHQMKLYRVPRRSKHSRVFLPVGWSCASCEFCLASIVRRVEFGIGNRLIGGEECRGV